MRKECPKFMTLLHFHLSPKLMVAHVSIHVPFHNELKFRTINHSVATAVTGAG